MDMPSKITLMTETTHNQTSTSPMVMSLRNAIAMNNSAITLIEKQSYEQGNGMLHDAYQMIRCTTTASGGDHDDGTAALCTIRDNCVQHYKYETQLKNQLSSPTVQSRHKTSIQFETITANLSNPIFITDEMPSKLYFIRIEDINLFDDYPSTLIECSILLNNLALSYIILSTVTVIESDYYKFRSVACTYSQLACTTYMKAIDTTPKLQRVDPELYRLLGFIFSNTEKIFFYCNVSIDQYNSVFTTKVIQLWEKIQRIESFFLTCTYGITDHTAAMA